MRASNNFMRVRFFVCSRGGGHPGHLLAAGQGGSYEDRFQGIASGNRATAKNQRSEKGWLLPGSKGRRQQKGRCAKESMKETRPRDGISESPKCNYLFFIFFYPKPYGETSHCTCMACARGDDAASCVRAWSGYLN